MRPHAVPVPRDAGTVVAEPVWVLVLLWAAGPPLGAGAAWLLRVAAGWVAELPWAPLPGWFELLARLPEPQATIGSLALGAVAGLALAHHGTRERLTVGVRDDRVTTSRAGSTHAIERGRVGVVFLDDRRLVIVGRAGEELLRETSDLDRERLAAAFVAHGYPWRPDGDPYRDQYRRWVEDTPDLPAGANALFKARGRALDKGDGEDAADLRVELAKLGVVVRDERKRQYWRRVPQRPR